MNLDHIDSDCQIASIVSRRNLDPSIMQKMHTNIVTHPLFHTFFLITPCINSTIMFAVESDNLESDAVNTILLTDTGHSNYLWPEDLFCDLVGWQPP